MTLNIEIETSDRELGNEFCAELPRGQSISLGDNIRFESQGVIMRKAFDIDVALYLLRLTVEFGKEVVIVAAAHEVVKWLRSCIKGRQTIIKIHRREINLNDEGQLTKIIEEEIERTTRSE